MGGIDALESSFHNLRSYENKKNSEVTSMHFDDDDVWADDDDDVWADDDDDDDW